MSQDDLAARATLSNSTIRAFEGGKVDQPNSRSMRMIEQALGWTTGSMDAIRNGREATVRDGRASRDPGDIQRQLGYLTAVINTAGDNGARLSDEAWEMLRAKALQDRRNVNAVLIDALRLHDELLGTGE